MSQSENQNVIPPLATKFVAPQLPLALVSRPRLLTELDVTPVQRLVLLSASAGFGKTTLLSTWASQSKHQIAWLTLDEEDNDPIRFWNYVIVALRKAGSRIGEATLAQFHASQDVRLPGALTSLINELAALEQEITLILDDYHVITEQAIHESLQFLLDHLPSGLQLLLASRVDPPLALSRLRARGQVVELRDADLRLNDEETAGFLTQAMHLSLSREDVQRLQTRTEGWVAGLQLAALSMRRHADLSAFIQAFTGTQRFILDYVQEEILKPLPELQQRFLLQTSVLDRMNAAICQALTGLEDTQQILESLERANLFLIPLDEERHWYRFHMLFREVLLARLHAVQSEQVPRLHRATATWYRQQGWLNEAISHALAAHDFPFIASVLEENVESLYLKGELKTLLAWIKLIPEDMMRTHPRLATSYILIFNMLFPFAHQQQAERAYLHHLQKDVEILVQDDDQRLTDRERGILRKRITLLTAWNLLAEGLSNGNLEQMNSVVQQMQHISLDDDTMWKLHTGASFAMASRLAGDFSPMVNAIQEFRKLVRTTQDRSLEVQFLWGQIAALIALGRLSQANDQCQVLQRLVESLGGPLPVAAYPDLFQAQLAYERNELDEAKGAAQRAIEKTAPLQYMDILMGAYEVLIRVHLVQGDLSEAEQELRELERLHQSTEIPLFRPWIDSLLLHLWLAQGDLTQAAHWAASTTYSHEKLKHHCERAYLALVRIYLAQRQYGPALRWLAALLTSAEQVERMGSVIAILALQVAVLQAAGNTREALCVLLRLLALAEPEGYIRVFLDAGEAMRQALQALLAEQSCPVSLALTAHARRILDAFASEQSQKTPEQSIPHLSQQSPTAPSALPEPLTQREQEVLLLLAEGASNQEIARQLIVSLATAKKHVANILSKLGAENRTQAIAHARSFSLL